MVSELILTSLLLLNNAADNNGQHFFDTEELIEIDSLKTDYSRTFKTNYGSYITFVTGDDETDKNVDDRSNESNSTVIQNKYIIMGDSSTYNGATLNVGQSSLYNVNGDDAIYKIVFNINLSTLPDDDYVIANAGIRMYKSNGNLDSLYCYKVNNLSYSQINGNSNLNTTYVDSSSVNTSGLFSYFDFDCTSEIITADNNGLDYINFLFEGHESNKQSTIYSKTSMRKPVFYFEYYSIYGCARPYFYLDNQSINCFCYAKYMQYFNNQQLPFFNSSNYSGDYCNVNATLGNYLGNQVVNYNVLSTAGFSAISNHFVTGHIRVISSYDSYINDNERRIAFRVKLNDSYRYAGDFHFICQCEDGSWAAKKGMNCTSQYLYENAPEINDDIWCPNSIAYNSPTVYLAYIEDSCPLDFYVGGLD